MTKPRTPKKSPNLSARRCVYHLTVSVVVAVVFRALTPAPPCLQIGRLVTDLHALERKLDKEKREKLELQQKLNESKTPLVVLQQEKVVM